MSRRYLHSLGDVNPIEHGGGYIIRRSEKGKPARVFLEYVEWDGEDDNARGSLYQVHIPKRGEVWKFLSWVQEGPRRDLAKWYGDEITQAAFVAGTGNVRFRANILMDVANYYGWANLDDYPVRVTRAELKKRWRTWGKVK